MSLSLFTELERMGLYCRVGEENTTAAKLETAKQNIKLQCKENNKVNTSYKQKKHKKNGNVKQVAPVSQTSADNVEKTFSQNDEYSTGVLDHLETTAKPENSEMEAFSMSRPKPQLRPMLVRKDKPSLNKKLAEALKKKAVKNPRKKRQKGVIVGKKHLNLSAVRKHDQKKMSLNKLEHTRSSTRIQEQISVKKEKPPEKKCQREGEMKDGGQMDRSVQDISENTANTHYGENSQVNFAVPHTVWFKT